MGQLLDIRVRKGKGRPHRVNLALDRLRERQDPTTLRLVVQANLPRGQSKPSRLQYQRLGSYLIDCRTPQAVAHVRAELANVMLSLSHLPTQGADTRHNGTRNNVPEAQARESRVSHPANSLAAGAFVQDGHEKEQPRERARFWARYREITGEECSIPVDPEDER